MFFSVKTPPEPDAVDRAIIRHLEAPPVQQTAEELFYASIASDVFIKNREIGRTNGSSKNTF